MNDRTNVVGVDVGGTYTDLFILDEATGACRVGKVPSQRGSEAIGILDGLERSGVALAHTATLVHGTTVGTNALLERKGACTGLITTAGFRDVLEMRRRDRPRTWGLWGSFEPVVPRDMRLEIDERTLADGTVRAEPDPERLKQLAAELVAKGARAVAVAFINAYANPENERIAVAAIRKVWPDPIYVTGSAELLPEIREFERTSTAALNAYLQPVVADYLQTLETQLRQRGFAGQVLIVQSNGGVMSIDVAVRRPIRTALSGPAAGVIAAAHIAKSAGFPNVITGDVGGTSFDVSLIAAGETVLSPQTAIDFGLVIRSPMIEITTIGAGGGSIASVDRGGILQVGPESAGSVPGPACYGRGNERPTVTDANLVLRRINGDRPIGGLVALHVEAAQRAIARAVGEPLGLDVMEAAEAIVQVANSHMAGAIRLVSIERGHDPRDFVLLPFGGGGALHAGALMKDVGLAKALVPRYPGVTSALGCVIADMRHDFVLTLDRLLADVDPADLDAKIRGMAADGSDLLDRSGVTFTGRDTIVAMDMSYVGQTHTISVMLPWRPDAGPLPRDAILTSFEQRYREAYGNLLDGIAVRILNLHVAAIGRRPKLDLSVLAPREAGSVDKARLGSRQVYSNRRWMEAAVFARLGLPVDAVVPGPALLEQADTTIWIEEDLEGYVDPFGNLIMQRKAAVG